MFINPWSETLLVISRSFGFEYFSWLNCYFFSTWTVWTIVLKVIYQSSWFASFLLRKSVLQLYESAGQERMNVFSLVDHEYSSVHKKTSFTALLWLDGGATLPIYNTSPQSEAHTNVDL